MEELQATLEMSRRIKKDMKKGLNRSELCHKYSEFQRNKPKTFFHILDGNFNEEMFVNIKNKYSNNLNSDTDEDKVRASMAVGDLLAKTYDVNLPSQEEKEDFISKLKKD